MEKVIDNLNNYIRKNPTIFTLLCLLVFAIIISIALFSYAYFTVSVAGEGKRIAVSASDLNVSYNTGNEIIDTEVTPGKSISKVFTVTNSSNSSKTYKLSWDYVVNNFNHKNYLKYTITSTNSGGSLSNTTFPSTGKNLSIINSVNIAPNTTQTYTLNITYQDQGQSQTSEEGKNLVGRFRVTDTNDNEIVPLSYSGGSENPIDAEKYLSNFSLQNVLKNLYPVGSIYTSTSSTNPSTLFPGTTWQAYGQGRTLVGIDSNNNKMDTVNETGGRYDAIIPEHSHSLNGTGASAVSAGDHTHEVTGQTEIEKSFADKIKEDNPPVSSPITTPGRQLSQTDEGLITGPQDDYGGTTYYFRGNVQDNYVSFAGKTWRIVRINGDGSVRMILDGITETTSAWNTEVDSSTGNAYETTDYNTMLRWLTYSNSPVKTVVDTWYNTNIGNNSTYDNMVATGKFCSDLSHTGNTPAVRFGAYERINISSPPVPQFNCPNSSDIYNLKASLINLEEVVFAGGKYGSSTSPASTYRNEYYYLYNSNINYASYTISPAYWGTDNHPVVVILAAGGYLWFTGLTYSPKIRPVINLKSDVVYDSGNGTSSNPYSIKTASVTNVNGEHTHNIAANGLEVYSNPTSTTTHQYDSTNNVCNSSIDDGCGSHGHSLNTDIANNKTTGASVATTTTVSGAHSHNFTFPSLDITTGSTVPLAQVLKTNNPPSNSPETTPGREISTTDEGLITGPNDDYGSPTYYFRGNVQDNYVSFAGYTWRVIRINGDGSVRMILNKNATNARFNTQIDSTSGDAYHTDNLATVISWSTYSNSPVKTNVDSWYSSNIGNNNTYDNMVATGKYCNDLSYTQSGDFTKFGAVNRLDNVSTATPQFICPNSSDIYNLKVGLITADEVAFAGATDYTSNSSNTSFFLYRNSDYWTMSPHSWNTDGNNGVRGFRFSKELDYHYINQSFAISPVINLKSDVVYDSGNGTRNSPYTVGLASGLHTHQTTAQTITSGEETGHTHTIAAGFESKNTAGVVTSGPSASHTHNLGDFWSTSSGSSSRYQKTSKRVLKHRYTATDGAHYHTFGAGSINVYSEAKTFSGGSHTHTFDVPTLRTKSGEGTHRHTIESTVLTTASDSSHTHSIPSLSGNYQGETTTASAHKHTINIPILTSSNTSDVTISSDGSGHSHSFTATAQSSGSHDHELTGNTTYAGTENNQVDANMQPYVTVYMWKRVS